MNSAARAAALALLVVATPVAAETWYVRPDGGDPSRCDGRSDRSVAAAGADRACAWRHPFDALPPAGTPRIAGGDTLWIRPGSYRIGFGAPGAEACSRDFPWDCHPPPLPSGPSRERPTRVLGGDERGRCDARPQLWGAERAAMVLNLAGSSHVELACLEITDRAACVENHCHGGACAEVARCERDAPPYGDWAGTGISARDSRDVLLRDLDIHGLALRGIHAGRLRDWRLQRVALRGNGWSGWDGDLGAGDSGNAGTLTFEQVEIAWNGCVERWPGRDVFGCWGQSAGGYGDGLGLAAGGGDWRFVEASVHHNASDGLDLLYLRAPSSLRVERSRLAANAGNQLKTSGDATLVGNRIDGECARLVAHGLAAGDACRAGGNAVVVVLDEAQRATLEDNVIAGQGDCLVVLEGGSPRNHFAMRGNRLHGAALWQDPGRRACGFYAHRSQAQQQLHANEFIGVRERTCREGNVCR